MEAKNLRIGNLIMFGDLRREITHHDITIIQECSIRNNMPPYTYSYIPLTKEWVEKLGGKTYNETTYISVPNLKAELHFEFFGNEVVTTLKSQFSDLILDPIKYVHNLQNLFFVLANDELELKS